MCRLRTNSLVGENLSRLPRGDPDYPAHKVCEGPNPSLPVWSRCPLSALRVLPLKGVRESKVPPRCRSPPGWVAHPSWTPGLGNDPQVHRNSKETTTLEHLTDLTFRSISLPLVCGTRLLVFQTRKSCPLKQRHFPVSDVPGQGVRPFVPRRWFWSPRSSSVKLPLPTDPVLEARLAQPIWTRRPIPPRHL